MSVSKTINPTLLQNFSQLIQSYTGLQIRSQDLQSLSPKIESRCRLIKITNAETYYNLLSNNTEESLREWQELVLLLTTGESYFFRDRGQFSILRDRLLPELIERQRNYQKIKGEPYPSLNLWSAGCSTGEEPYSLAILLTELIPDWEQWNIVILGTDINRLALEKARQAIYSSWSFRWVDPTIQKRYFTPHKQEWKLQEKISRLVEFRYDNLVSTSPTSLPSMDLIICRNVFVYFEPWAISSALTKFTQYLKPESYLITGHTELNGHDLNQFQIKVFPESVVYQRKPVTTIRDKKSQSLIVFAESKSPLVQSKPEPIKETKFVEAATAIAAKTITKKSDRSLTEVAKSTVSEPQVLDVNSLLQEVRHLFKTKSYLEAIQKCLQLIELKSHRFEACFLMAQIYANLGDLERATMYCQRAIEANSLSATPLYLLAHIAEEKGEIEKAKECLKRIIYLEPNSIAAYLELGALYSKQNQINRANKMWAVVLDLLNQLPLDSTVEYQGEVTVKELLQQVKKNLKNNQ